MPATHEITVRHYYYALNQVHNAHAGITMSKLYKGIDKYKEFYDKYKSILRRRQHEHMRRWHNVCFISICWMVMVLLMYFFTCSSHAIRDEMNKKGGWISKDFQRMTITPNVERLDYCD